MFAAHSLTMAQKLYDAQVPALLLELSTESMELETDVLKGVLIDFNYVLSQF